MKKIARKNLPYKAYLDLCRDATVVESDRHGVKVYQLTDGNYLKLFRLKKLFSSALFYSYEKRFERNARLLQEAKVPTVSVCNLWRIKKIQRTAVHYSPLAGTILRDLYGDSGQLADNEVVGLAEFIAGLHAKGIYFRSLHLGNVVKTSAGDLGLIDISDLKKQNRSLSIRSRIRNFRHLFRYPIDLAAVSSQKGNPFINGYLAQTKLRDKQKQILEYRLRGLWGEYQESFTNKA